MVKKVALFCGVAVFGIFPLNVQGAGVKMGFVNTLEVLYGTEEGKHEIEVLNRFAASKQQEIEAQTAQLQKLTEQYQNQQRTLNPETRVEMERTLGDRQRRLKRLQEDVQFEYDQRRDALLGAMSEKIQKIIIDYAPKNGFGVIFMRDQGQSFVDPKMEVTQSIIKIYNEQHPVSGKSSEQ